ncbi:MAG: hypothetical protein F4143_11305, partial [Gemmatimonadales bacterium]|nr:hypothetical protein [Gemmatimonadales bacterium]
MVFFDAWSGVREARRAGLVRTVSTGLAPSGGGRESHRHEPWEERIDGRPWMDRRRRTLRRGGDAVMGDTATARRAVSGWAIVDLFCGIGGLSHGLRQAGFTISGGVDADETCRYAFEKNNGAAFVGRPLEDMSATEIAALFPEDRRRILVGCAPCTPFSPYSAGPGEPRDKWSLVDLFMDRIAETEPAIV